MFKRKCSGFTLMEMLIVVTIIGVLAAIVLPRFTATSERARKNAHITERQTLNAQIELFRFQEGQYPSDMTNEGWSTDARSDAWQDYLPDGVPDKCNQGVAWKIDPDTHRISEDGHEEHE